MQKNCTCDDKLDSKTVQRHIYKLLAVVVLIVIGYIALEYSGALATLQDEQRLQAWLARLGWWGPLAIIFLLTGAIVWSPIPSAPIALASGAAYGQVWGTLYVLLGAEIGALLAFTLARRLGRDLIERWLGRHTLPTWMQCSDRLVWIVFASRLMPFISFDAVSYAAGLTSLSGKRFALATLLGIAPASFILAHFGHEMRSGDAQRIFFTVLGGLALFSMLFMFYVAYRSSSIFCSATDARKT